MRVARHSPERFPKRIDDPGPTRRNDSIPENGFVSIKIYNILGKEVFTLVEGEQSSGSYKVSFNGSSLTSGIYFYKLKANQFIQTRKFIILK